MHAPCALHDGGKLNNAMIILKTYVYVTFSLQSGFIHSVLLNNTTLLGQ